jgi:CarD family transcriptional regulator
VLIFNVPDDLGDGGLSARLADDRGTQFVAAEAVLERTAVPPVVTPSVVTPIVVPPTVIVATATAAAPLVAAPPEERPFRKGDLVVYPTHGLGTVDQVRVEEIGGHRANWIKISFAENRMSLRIPVGKAGQTGLRRPVTRTAFVEVLAIIRGRPHANRTVWTKRAMEYQGKINSGSVKALAEVVRDLRPSADGSESSFSRRGLFEMAMDRLAVEFAAVFRTDKAVAIGRLMPAPPAA